MVGSYKVDGYRVQVYAGGNSRKDRQTAEEIGAKLKRSFPTRTCLRTFFIRQDGFVVSETIVLMMMQCACLKM